MSRARGWRDSNRKRVVNGNGAKIASIVGWKNM